ncbi:hypothetical protein GDO81_001143 [Engystomops pustulosus]|uniref:Secreted protein n=1 Tax=Engystomops pustulosus TaxID=76066 RepID=A0AAV7D9Z4_ENGPU|nr:hypothetical protein GDO81_001143 [Engystomops pustulosus]
MCIIKVIAVYSVHCIPFLVHDLCMWGRSGCARFSLTPTAFWCSISSCNISYLWGKRFDAVLGVRKTLLLTRSCEISGCQNTHFSLVRQQNSSVLEVS